MKDDLIKTPYHPQLKTSMTLTGYCLAAPVFRFIELSFKDFAELRISDRALIDATVKAFYQGAPVDQITGGDATIAAREAIYNVLSIGEFIISSCRIYQSLRGLPYKTAVGVVNERYRAVSAIALLQNTTVDQLAGYEELLRTIRTTDFTKTNKPGLAFGSLISEMMTVYVMPIAREMVKLKMRAVKNADRRQWNLS